VPEKEKAHQKIWLAVFFYESRQKTAGRPNMGPMPLVFPAGSPMKGARRG